MNVNESSLELHLGDRLCWHVDKTRLWGHKLAADNSFSLKTLTDEAEIQIYIKNTLKLIEWKWFDDYIPEVARL